MEPEDRQALIERHWRRSVAQAVRSGHSLNGKLGLLRPGAFSQHAAKSLYAAEEVVKDIGTRVIAHGKAGVGASVRARTRQVAAVQRQLDGQPGEGEDQG